MPRAVPRPTTDDRIRAALWFAEHGFGVFTVWSTTADGTCRCPKGATCDSPGKHPITAQGFHDATTDPERIRTLLTAGSEPNWGLVCPDGVFALDVDGDGVARLAELEARLGPLPETLRTNTAHGQHVFLRWPDDVPRPIGQLWGFVTRWGSGAGAGYVIGPRSVHASGAVYEPAGGSLEVAELPAFWAADAIAERAPAAPGTFVVTSGGYVLPDRVTATESRYEAIRAYTAHLYNMGLDAASQWALVREILAPRFDAPLPEPDLRARFERLVKDQGARLGEPRLTQGGRIAAVQPRSADEISASSIDAADLLELDIPPLQWIVPDLLPEGTTVLAGPPKLGKSCFVYQVAVEVSLGGNLLGRAITQGDALYLALEDGQRRGQTRLRAALEKRRMPKGRLTVRWSTAKLGQGLEDELTTWLDTHPSARFVAIDTLQRVRARADSRRNAYEVDVEDLGRLQNLFRDRAVGLLVVHHVKKERSDDFLASVSGTYGITGSVDTTLVFQRARHESYGKLVATGRDIEEAEVSVRFDEMRWDLAPEAMSQASKERQAVYEIVRDHGPIHATAVAEALGLTRGAAEQLLRRMADQGALAVVPGRKTGGYVINDVFIKTDLPSPESSNSSNSTDDPSRAHTRVERVPSNSSNSMEAEGVPSVTTVTGDTHLRARTKAGIELVESAPLPTGWCNYPAEHSFRHRDVLTDSPWCEICSPPPPEVPA